LVDDQVLRGYLALIDATLRTSHYVPDEQGGPWATVTLKLDGRQVPDVPAPRTYVETFVHSTRFEGLHLRAGPIARGGIRWSDRQNDLRTEVLGLMRAQVLKNAGIVATGAKGGFVCRRLVRDPHGWLPLPRDIEAEVKACYQLFIQSLLDVTDNVVKGQVVTPPGVRPADGEDPYLVVAADRGTAVLSDLANQISLSTGFWLGDAFASGGSHGYDHKAIGITARGAWKIVQQHFRQLGMDVQHDAVRVVGVGDMSGDVFGNGMLSAPTIELVAAFDHRHIFIDPSPDPERSYEERKRLFSLPRSSWQDYDRTKLSPGGGVWSRTVKEIDLSPEARAALGLGIARGSAGGIGESRDLFRPPEVVSAILVAPVDLLWMGGIGTFVKAANESNSDVGDHTNDSVRITADKLRARVVAEGGNLGLTQRARIAYSRRGGKINTDFIDNAAGVEISDREVNLKILLALAIERDLLAPGDRDAILHTAQDEIVATVLSATQLAAESVTRAVPESAADLDAFDALMGRLELAGRLDRKVEALPDAEEIGLRRAAGAGLTRPEAAVIYAHAKADLTEALVPSLLSANPEVRPAVEAYFPASVIERFGALVEHHRLHDQLAAIQVAGEVVDRMGITWAHEIADEFGTGVAEVAVAYWAARQVMDAGRWWAKVDELAPSISADTEALMYTAVRVGLDRLARSYMVQRVADLATRVGEDRPIAAGLEGFLSSGGGASAGEGAAGGEGAGPDAGVGARSGAVAEALVKDGVSQVVAEGFGRLGRLGQSGDVAAAARSLGRSPAAVISAFNAVDETLQLGPFELQLGALHPGGRWERWQARRLADDLARIRRRIVVAALGGAGDGSEGAVGAVGAFASSRADAVARFERLAGQVDGASGRSGEALALAALAIRALDDLVSG
jgi:glutamate dehydrogenase